jgi:hypothetical protein
VGELPSFGVRQAPEGALAAPLYIDARKLAANTAEAVTPPPGAAVVVFRPKFEHTVFYVRYDGLAAAEPAGDVSDGSASEPNPYARDIQNVASFSIVSPQDGAVITMLFYSDESESAELVS